MNTPRIAIVLTAVNVLVLACSLGQSRIVKAQGPLPVLRGRALEIVDDAGRVRASISILPPDPDVKMPDGTTGYPETVLLRLITSAGRPNVKIAAMEGGSGQLLAGASDSTYVQMLAEGAGPTVKLSAANGHVRVIEP